MKLILKYVVYLFFNFLILNKIKVLLILLSFIGFFLADIFVYDKSVKIIKEYELNGEFVYVYQNNNRLENITFDRKIDLDENSNILIIEKRVKIIIRIFSMVIIATILMILIAHDDDYIGYSFSEIKYRSFISLIECVIEDNIYYYIIGDRLIYKTNRISNKSDIALKANIYEFSKINKFPKFISKKYFREKLINKILK